MLQASETVETPGGEWEFTHLQRNQYEKLLRQAEDREHYNHRYVRDDAKEQRQLSTTRELRDVLAANVALQRRVEELTRERNEYQRRYEHCKLQAQCHSLEADTQTATVRECYAAVGATGKGTWNASVPVAQAVQAERERAERAEQQLAAAREAVAKEMCGMCAMGKPHDKGEGINGYWHGDSMREPSPYGSWPFPCAAARALRVMDEAALASTAPDAKGEQG